MAHQMKNLSVFSVFRCAEGAFGAAFGGTTKIKNGAPRDELKNDCGRGWSGTDMTGRPGYRTMEMNGGSSASHLTCTPCVPLFVHCLIRVETELDYQGRAGDHFHCTVEPSPRSYSVSSWVSSQENHGWRGIHNQPR